MVKGELIVFEGLDKSGKETQSEMLTDYLNSKRIKTAIMHYPDYTSKTGQCIRRYLDGNDSLEQFSQKTINLLYTANRYETKHWINYFLNIGTCVILDRYYFSNMAYGSFDGQDAEIIAGLDSDMPKPDLVIFIDISAETSMKRSGKDADKNEKNLAYLRNVRENYHILEWSNRWNGWFSVNGEEDKEEIHEQIVAIVKDRLFPKK